MKFLIASDIHGSATWCRKFIDAIHAEKPDKIILLGDILYHGPRNDLPNGYDPKEVIALLNPLADRILAVRGNCDAEVDQMVLDFPCMADYSTILDPEYIDEDAGYEMQTPRTLFLTHGHVFGPDRDGAIGNLPQMPVNTALLYGHTHVKANPARKILQFGCSTLVVFRFPRMAATATACTLPDCQSKSRLSMSF